MSNLPPIDQIKISLPKFNLPPLSSPSKNTKSLPPVTKSAKPAKRVATKDLNKVFVVIYIYLDDPDGNGVELYWDKPKEQWPFDKDGNLHMVTEHLDIPGLLAEARK